MFHVITEEPSQYVQYHLPVQPSNLADKCPMTGTNLQAWMLWSENDKISSVCTFWFALIENIHSRILETISISQVTFICFLFSIYQDHTLHPLPTWTGTRSIGVPVEFPDNGQWFDRFRYCKCVTSGWSNICCWSNGSVLQVCFMRMILFSTLEAYSFFLLHGVTALVSSTTWLSQ